MTALQQKTLRDLTRQGSSALLTVLAIATGIAGFTAVLSTYAILTRELNRSYLATNPASATLRMGAIDAALLAAVRANPDIADADTRRVVSGQIKRPDAGWHTLRLFVVPDFSAIRIGKLAPEQGAWPPAPGEILIERDAFSVADLHIGDAGIVKTAEGGEHAVRISGSLHDTGQAQARMENIVYGYATLETLARLGEQPFLDRLNILVAANQLDEAHIGAVAAKIKTLAEAHGQTVRSVDIPTPGEHPHAHIMAVLFLSMSTFGFCILALSGILVVNLITSIMATQVRQIGVMKAIGGSRGQIASIYLSQALLLGASAILCGLPPGILGGRALSRAMAVFLNFDLASLVAPAWIYVLAAALGLLVPLLAAAYPVWQGSRIPIRLALADCGVPPSAAFGTTSFDRALAGFGGPLRPLLFGIRNSFRRRSRVALTLATLFAGGLFCLSGLNVRSSLVHTLDRFFAARKYDLSANLREPYPVDTIQRAIGEVHGIAQWEAWFVTEASVESGRLSLTGLPPNTQSVKLDIIEGRDLRPGDTGVIVVNTALADAASGLSVGRDAGIQVGSAHVNLRVIGVAREQFSPPAGYVPRDFLNRLAARPGMANAIRVTVADRGPASLDRVQTALDAQLERQHIRAEPMASTAGSRFAFDQHMVMIYVFLVIVSTIIAAIGSLGLMTSMTLTVLERRRELGVLRAIGASPLAVAFIVVTEGVVLAVISWALAAVAAWPLSKLLGDFIGTRILPGGLDFRFELSGLLIWLAVSLVLGMAASLVPAWNASRTAVREALSHE